ncbi:MAG: hypothetical protein R3B70_12005 [Polyangiaceae bacterium]
MRFSGMAPQSIGTNGPDARREAACSERATTSLPVPVSPSMSTVVSVGATRSRIAYSRRMSMLCPTSSPNDVRGDTSTNAGSSPASTRKHRAPQPNERPAGTSPSRSRTPDTYVPFVDPRSRSAIPSGRTFTSQCSRDTVGSARRRSLPIAVPTRATPPCTAHRAPRAGPSTTTRSTDGTRIPRLCASTRVVPASSSQSDAMRAW